MLPLQGLFNLVLSFCNFASWCLRTIHLIQFSAFLNFQPLVGEEPNLIKNLQTFFELNYPKVRKFSLYRYHDHSLIIFPILVKQRNEIRSHLSLHFFPVLLYFYAVEMKYCGSHFTVCYVKRE